MTHKYQRLGLGGCDHAPYVHRDRLDFYAAVKQEYDLTWMVHLGDEWDMHQYSYHEKDPQLKGGKDETTAAQVWSRELEEVWENLDILHSNHASLVYRKAKTAGIPELFLKSYREVHGVGKGWNWHFQMHLTLPDGTPLHLSHGTKVDAWTKARREGVNAACAHRHSEHYTRRFQSFTSNRWAMQVGCGIDAESRAFAYGKEDITQPILGMGVVIDSFPILVPMRLTKSGRWTNKL